VSSSLRLSSVCCAALRRQRRRDLMSAFHAREERRRGADAGERVRTQGRYRWSRWESFGAVDTGDEPVSSTAGRLPRPARRDSQWPA
jgi:hypothetical protein